VVAHRAELDLSDDQIRSLEQIDQEREQANQALGAAKPAAKPDPAPPGGGSGSGGGMRGMRGMGGRHRGHSSSPRQPDDARATMQQRIDDNDTSYYLEAEKVLSETQQPRAREIAESYREQLYERRAAKPK
jgi:hypothetical protein